MPITNGYAALPEIKERLTITDASEDTLLEQIVTATSREIDNWTHRRFYPVTETRYYTPEYVHLLEIDDLLSVTTLKTDRDGDRTYETTWVSGDFDLEPYNALLNGEPYTAIRVTPNGANFFPVPGGGTIGVSGAGRSFPAPSAAVSVARRNTKSVEINGSFGYSSTTPAVIKEACLIQTARLYKRKGAPFGVQGYTDFGQAVVIASLDPDVKQLIKDLKKKGSL